MSLYQPFYNRKIGVVDLTTLSTYMVELPLETCQEHVGGAAINARILAEYESDSLVFGTGPLTGTFAPASALLVGTFRSLRYDHLCHVPFMLRCGPEMKFSGVDFLVIRGAAKESCAISIDRGSVRIVPLTDDRHRTVPELMQLLKRNAPTFRTCIAAGPAAEQNSPFAAASIEGHGSLDRSGLASRMAAKNLKAILFNGIEGLSIREDHPTLAKAVEKMLQDSGARASKGFIPVVRRLPDGEETAKILRGKIGRNRACYHCPCPCMTYAGFRKPGDGTEKEGLLLMDHSGWASLSLKSNDALPLLHRCLELGLDPRAAGYGLREDRPLRESINAIDKLATTGASIDEEDYPSTPDIDTRTYRIFGGGIPPLASGEVWTERVATAMILGVCPIFMQLARRLNRTDLLRFISGDAEEIKVMGERIDREISVLLEGKIPSQG